MLVLLDRTSNRPAGRKIRGQEVGERSRWTRVSKQVGAGGKTEGEDQEVM